jgi:hypothetical protein
MTRGKNDSEDGAVPQSLLQCQRIVHKVLVCEKKKPPRVEREFGQQTWLILRSQQCYRNVSVPEQSESIRSNFTLIKSRYKHSKESA